MKPNTDDRTIIHVNRQFIAINAKYGQPVLPTYIVRENRKKNAKTTYCFGVRIMGECELIDPRHNEPLVCGARAWMETNAELELIEPMSYQDAMKLKKEYGL